MQKKTLLIILLTVLVFLSACTLGVSTVYRVDEVTVRAATLSEEAETEAAQLRDCLQEAYQKKSMFSIDESIAESVVAQFPYFRIVSMEKVYPSGLIFSVSEDEEVYAVEKQDGNGYYILNGQGTVLSVRDDYVNRKEKDTNAKNVLLTGFNVTAEKGQMVAGDDAFSYVLPFCTRVSELLDGIRKNVVSVQLIKGGSSTATHVLRLEMIEGVVVYVRNPSENTLVKAEKAIEAYLGLPDGAHTKGMITVYEQGENVVTRYSMTDDFSYN